MAARPTIRLGLIGAGPWGCNYIRTIQGLDHVSLVRVGSRNPQTKLLVNDNCRVSSDWREVLDPDDVDGIVIATPPALHGLMAREAVSLGLAVLVEKPLTLNFDEAVSLRRMVNTYNGFVMVDHTHLFHPAYKAIKQFAAKAGPVRAIRSIAGNRDSCRDDVSVLWDWGPHDIAMCLDLLGSKPIKVIAERLEARDTEKGYGENLLLRLIFPGDVTADIRLGTLMDKTRKFAVWFGKAVLFYNDLAEHKLTIHPSNTDFDGLEHSDEIVRITEDLPLANVVKTFAKAIITGARDTGSLDLGIDVVSVLSGCENALK